MASNNVIDDPDSAVDRTESMHISLQQDQVLVHNLVPEEPHGTTTTIKSVSIIVGDSFTELTEAGIRTLEETLSVHTNLKYINIERLTHATTSISVRALIRILRLENLCNLTDLRILGTNLQGNLQDWHDLATVIGDNLRKLEFICIVEPLSWLPRVPSKALDPVLNVCGRHESLKFVATNLLSGVSLEVIDLFCESKHVMGLHLVDADSVSHDKVYRFFKGMQTNTKVWFLSVAFAETITREHGKAIAQLLQSNETITNLSIKSKLSIQEDFLLELVKGLRDASKLEELSLEGSEAGPVISNSCREAIVNMLEENRSLHKLQLEGVKCDGLVKEIEIYTRLNRAGRRKLLGSQPTDNQNWINVLGHEAVRNDLNCTYYLLSKNPQLIGCKEEPEQLPQTRKRKHLEISTSASPR